jgi:hypothetical protein
LAKLFVEVTLRAIKDGRVYSEDTIVSSQVEEGAEFNALRRAYANAGLDFGDQVATVKATKTK